MTTAPTYASAGRIVYTYWGRVPLLRVTDNFGNSVIVNVKSVMFYLDSVPLY